MISSIAQQTTAFAPVVKLFSPTDSLPPALSGMSPEMLDAHIAKAKRVIELHEDNARNGDRSAEHYYFFIPEVARDIAHARYTLSVMFAELHHRKLENKEVSIN